MHFLSLSFLAQCRFIFPFIFTVLVYQLSLYFLAQFRFIFLFSFTVLVLIKDNVLTKGILILFQVRPPIQSDFNDAFVNKQLNVIRDFVQTGDADRATELAFMLMSTVKDFRDESFERKSVSALHYNPSIPFSFLSSFTAITKYPHACVIH